MAIFFMIVSECQSLGGAGADGIFQTRTVPSKLPLTSVAPSAEYVRDLTPLLCGGLLTVCYFCWKPDSYHSLLRPDMVLAKKQVNSLHPCFSGVIFTQSISKLYANLHNTNYTIFLGFKTDGLHENGQFCLHTAQYRTPVRHKYIRTDAILTVGGFVR